MHDKIIWGIVSLLLYGWKTEAAGKKEVAGEEIWTENMNEIRK